MNYAENWNRLDSFIFFWENKISGVKAAVCAAKEEEPDVELMIQAETEHLRNENEILKKRDIPIYLIEDEGKYFCPKCRMEAVADARYCSNCGHRIIKGVRIGG